MLGILTICFGLAPCVSDDEPQSGRPLRDGCSGLVDSVLYLHEEYYIRKGDCFDGRVLAIEGDTITVKKWRRVPRIFRVSPVLASADIPIKWELGAGHRLGQLRVGDRVDCHLAHARDGYVCINLGICRRPGGRIPEAEDSHLSSHSRLHVRCAVDQFVEEKFVPKLLPRLAFKLPR